MTTQRKTRAKTASPSNGAGPSFASVDDILAADDLGEEIVEVKEWGGAKVKVRGISRAQFRAVEAKSTTEGDIDSDMADAWLMHFGMVDPAVTYEQAEHILQTKSINSCQAITSAIMEASGLGDQFRA